jgi:hypothetical protein
VRVAKQAVDADVRRVANGLQDIVGFHAGLLGLIEQSF